MFTQFFKKKVPLWQMLIALPAIAALAWGLYSMGRGAKNGVAEFFVEQHMRADVAITLDRLERFGYDLPIRNLIEGQRRIDDLLTPDMGIGKNETHIHTRQGAHWAGSDSPTAFATRETTMCLLLNAIVVRAAHIVARPPAICAKTVVLTRGWEYEDPSEIADQFPEPTVAELVYHPDYETLRAYARQGYDPATNGVLWDIQSNLRFLVGGRQSSRRVRSLLPLICPYASLPRGTAAREEYSYLADAYNRLMAKWRILGCSWPDKYGDFYERALEEVSRDPLKYKTTITPYPTENARSFVLKEQLPSDMPKTDSVLY